MREANFGSWKVITSVPASTSVEPLPSCTRFESQLSLMQKALNATRMEVATSTEATIAGAARSAISPDGKELGHPRGLNAPRNSRWLKTRKVGGRGAGSVQADAVVQGAAYTEGEHGFSDNSNDADSSFLNGKNGTTLLSREEEFKESYVTSQLASKFKSLYQVTDTKPKPRKVRASQKVELPVELCQPPVTGNVTMPFQKQEGLEADVAGMGVETLVVTDSVYNKELSWLAFNWRVLHMALDARTPLLERLRFLAISARNLDELFCTRVGALKRQEAAGVKNLINVEPRMTCTPHQQLKNVAREVRLMMDTQIACLTDDILPALKKKGVNLVNYDELHLHEKDLLRLYFKSSLESILTPLAVDSGHPFPTTRNADVTRNEEEAEDLLEIIDEMRELRIAPFVRLEVDYEMPLEVVHRLTLELGLRDKDDVYIIRGPVSLGELDSLPVKLEMNSPLVYKPWTAKTHPRLQGAGVFEVMRKGDILLHHPYHSFVTSTQLFVEAAANDPQVAAIKATLYRTNNDSPIISALAKAAESGKQVAVLVELKARFDEVRNMGFAQKLGDAGCNVAYGLVGLKTHCKCIMVVRKEEDRLRTYVHIGTGNYNPRTASVYADFGLFSCDPDLGMDVTDLFKYLTGYHRQVAYRKLLVAPGTMRNEFIFLIEREISNAQAGKPASIIVKCDGLDDQMMVTRLYEASRAGVKIDCIVRGICRIRTGIPNVSENIRVVSILGRFLEHHRIFRFENGEKAEYYMGSADWMTRNLTLRVEVVTPVEDEALKKELQEILDACLCDRRKAWEMRPDGRYQLLGTGTMKNPPRKHSPQAASPKLIAAVQARGLHAGLMETYAKRCQKAKKANLRKKSGNAIKASRQYDSR